MHLTLVFQCRIFACFTLCFSLLSSSPSIFLSLCFLPFLCLHRILPSNLTPLPTHRPTGRWVPFFLLLYIYMEGLWMVVGLSSLALSSSFFYNLISVFCPSVASLFPSYQQFQTQLPQILSQESLHAACMTCFAWLRLLIFCLVCIIF